MTEQCTHEEWQRYVDINRDADVDGPKYRCAGCDTDAVRHLHHPYTASKVVGGTCPVCGGRHLEVYGRLVEHLVNQYPRDAVRCEGSGDYDVEHYGITAHYAKCAAEGRDSGD